MKTEAYKEVEKFIKDRMHNLSRSIYWIEQTNTENKLKQDDGTLTIDHEKHELAVYKGILKDWRAYANSHENK